MNRSARTIAIALVYSLLCGSSATNALVIPIGRTARTMASHSSGITIDPNNIHAISCHHRPAFSRLQQLTSASELRAVATEWIGLEAPAMIGIGLLLAAYLAAPKDSKTVSLTLYSSGRDDDDDFVLAPRGEPPGDGGSPLETAAEEELLP